MNRAQPSVLPASFAAALLSVSLLAPAAAGAAGGRISAAALAAPVRFLSSDALEGRGPGSAGDRLARLYLATELESLGLVPAGGTAAAPSWEQSFPMIGIDSQAPPIWEFTAPQGRLALARREEFIAVSGVQKETAALADAEVVFVGYGIQAPEFGWDDFKGVDLKGKVLLMLNNDPDWDENLFAGKRRLYYGRWTYKYESAARQGAAGAILIHTTPSAGYPFQVVQSSWSSEQFELPAGSEPRLQVAGWTTENAAERLVALSGRSLATLVEAAKSKAFRPVPLGVHTSLALTNRIRQVETANVAGRLPGSDPQLADEAVIYTAHHDHLGVATADASGDAIHNGAVDNATGCAQLLALAKAFAALPEAPRRSLVFLFVAAEEQGLLGSSTSSRIRRSHPGRSPPTSISIRRTSTAAPKMSPSSASASRRSTPWSSPRLRRRGASSTATRRRRKAPSTAPTSSTSRASACQRLTSTRARSSSTPPGTARRRRGRARSPTTRLATTSRATRSTRPGSGTA